MRARARRTHLRWQLVPALWLAANRMRFVHGAVGVWQTKCNWLPPQRLPTRRQFDETPFQHFIALESMSHGHPSFAVSSRSWLLASLVLLTLAIPAEAQRVALVVGNAA
jgi:hypothetical protein